MGSSARALGCILLAVAGATTLLPVPTMVAEA
jgi:hypothetical protein